MLALLTYPITRGITARLARLQTGVLQFGAGNLSARVKVEGRDEVATLAKSFNDSAERIEQLVRAHQLLLANCSHELRTPLARIRLAVDRVPGTDAAVSAELARNIAELDALIGEMLLSSRLDVARASNARKPVDLLALAAEEAAHFDLEVERRRGDASRRIRCCCAAWCATCSTTRASTPAAPPTFASSSADGIARIVVEDAGAGVPAGGSREDLRAVLSRIDRYAVEWRGPRACRSSGRSRARTAAPWNTRRVRRAAAASR